MSDESPKLTKKQRRKAAQRRQLLTFVGILVLVLVVAAAVLGFQRLRGSDGETAPADLRITAVAEDGSETELAPYSVCAFDDADCAGDEPTTLDLPADGKVTLKLPTEIYDHDWKLVQIYDDPATNTENTFAANEATEVTLRGSSDKEDAEGNHPRLTVAEIQTILADESGDEPEPVAAVWSVAPSGVQEGAE